MRKSILLLAISLLSEEFIAAQTNPSVQTLPYSQNFGTVAFSTMPAGMQAWTGLSGAAISTQILAEASDPSGDASVGSKTASTTIGGTYSYTSSGNARLYIQTSSSTTKGVDQLVIAINTGSNTSVTVEYDVEAINDQADRSLGSVLQYRQGNSGSWTTVTSSNILYGQSSTNNGDADANGDVDHYSFTISGLAASTDYQLRWAHWRTSGSGGSVGIAYDNIIIDATAAAPLPVKFGNVKATQTNNCINLQWNNLTETEVENYFIEHSINAHDFITIAYIKPTKNNGGEVSYQYLDRSVVNGNNFYRIKAKEISGKISYSSIIKITIGDKSMALTIYPNPVKGNQLGLQISNLTAGNYLIKIYNSIGQPLSIQTLNHAGGSLSQTFLLNNLKPGIYNFEISGPDKMQKQFIVQ